MCFCHFILDPFHSLPNFHPAYQQDQLIQTGVIPRLVSIIREYPENDPLVNVCLLALCNLADMGDYFVIVLIIVINYELAVIEPQLSI